MTGPIATDHRIASGRDGLALLLRNKRVRADGPPVLFVHGATYPGTVVFDYVVEGRSWMDCLAAAGFDAWCVDLLGYGGADRPPEMLAPADDHGPIVDTAEAAADVRRAVDYILTERGVAQLDLVGYSWGTAISGAVAGEIPASIRRLVLSGALWILPGPGALARAGALGAYRTVDARAVVKRWTQGLDAAQQAAIAPPERLSQWADAAVASDPAAASHQPPRMPP